MAVIFCYKYRKTLHQLEKSQESASMVDGIDFLRWRDLEKKKNFSEKCERTFFQLMNIRLER